MYIRNGIKGTVKVSVRLGAAHLSILEKYPVANRYVNDCLGEFLKKLERGTVSLAPAINTYDVDVPVKSVRLYVATAYYESMKRIAIQQPDYIVTTTGGRVIRKTTMTTIIKRAIENGNKRTLSKDSLPSHKLTEEFQ